MSKLHLLLIAALAGAMLTTPAAAAARTAKPRTGELYISLTGATLHSVALYVSDFTGKPVVLPPRFPGDKTVKILSSSRAGIPAAKAMNVFATALRSHGFAMVATEDYIWIVSENEAKGVPLREKPAEAGLEAQTLATTVVEVKNADVALIVPILDNLRSKAGRIQTYTEGNKIVITEYGGNLKAMLRLVRKLDEKRPGGTHEICKLRNASVGSLQSIVTSYVKNLAAGADPMLKKRLATLAVHTHTATNAFVLLGHPADVAKVKRIIRTLDVKPDASTRRFHTYPVLNRDVDELAKVLKALFEAAKGREDADAGPAPAYLSRY